MLSYTTNSQREKDSRKKQKFSIIGAALGWGAQISETELGPEFLFQSSLPQDLIAVKKSLFWEEIIFPVQRIASHHIPLGPRRVPVITDHSVRLAQKIVDTVHKQRFPVVIGGDHSIAIGTWSGLTQAHQARGKFGLLWMDAHMDAHTPETSPSQAYHGMPVATLMGYGSSLLTQITSPEAKIKPEHIVVYGIRCYESAEEAFLEKLGVRIYYMEEILERGIEATLSEALDYLERNTEGFGVSIDLDVFDPLEVPGVGSPVTGGLPVEETLLSLQQLQERTTWWGLEITEFNPLRDQDNKTFKTIQRILETVIVEEKYESEDLSPRSSQKDLRISF